MHSSRAHVLCGIGRLKCLFQARKTLQESTGLWAWSVVSSQIDFVLGHRGPVFRTHFGGVPPGAWQRARQPQGPPQPVNPVTQLLHFLPVLLLLLFTFLQMPGQPVSCCAHFSSMSMACMYHANRSTIDQELYGHTKQESRTTPNSPASTDMCS